MIIKNIYAKSILDSRNENTILVCVETKGGKFFTSAPSGKSTGAHEAHAYAKTLEEDIKFVNRLNPDFLNELNLACFHDLHKIEALVKDNIGANTLFALESSLLKAMAGEKGIELWKFLNPHSLGTPRPIGNAIGGGMHSKGVNGTKPDFQEFLFISNGRTFKECVKVNKLAYRLAGKIIKGAARNDEGAWETILDNEDVLRVMGNVRKRLRKRGHYVEIGIDVASSSFYKEMLYHYKNPLESFERKKQIDYLLELIKKYDIFYVEDPLNENDFTGFSMLNNQTKAMITGDDLTTTNPSRLETAVKMKSIKGIIVKPNQIGSLLKTHQVIEIAKKHGVKVIISHRSGETMDDTIADLAVAWHADFIKTGTYGKVRSVKLKRLVRIEKKMR
ncbi:MAG: enolase C-terminal domain-like protein [Candidatus Nanoarchaeia archaeon]